MIISYFTTEFKILLRHNVISLVEGSPHKVCDQGWNFDNSNVFNTITSEVKTTGKEEFL